MNVDSKYYRNHTFHRTLLQNMDDPVNSVISCGFLHKQGNRCIQKDISFQYYGGLYVISGRGIYVDAQTNEEFPVYPGCILQRMPGKIHHTYIEPDSNWLKFFFCAGAKIFETLVSMKLVTDKPVFYVGEKVGIFNRLLEYHKLFERTDDYNSVELLMEFQKLLCFLNSYSSNSEKDEWMHIVCEKLKSDTHVGIPLKKIASECSVSYESMRKQFRQIFGCSLSQYRIQQRINRAKTMLIDQNMPIKEVAGELGYCDTYAFCNQFKRQVGIPPGRFVSEYRKSEI